MSSDEALALAWLPLGPIALAIADSASGTPHTHATMALLPIVPVAAVLLAGEPGVGKSTLLLEVANRWARTGRRTLYVTAEESAAQVATSIIDNLTRPLNLKGHELVVTTSIGIALHPLHGRNGDDLLKFADSAMYLAKSQGRNRYQIPRCVMCVAF